MKIVLIFIVETYISVTSEAYFDSTESIAGTETRELPGGISRAGRGSLREQAGGDQYEVPDADSVADSENRIASPRGFSSFGADFVAMERELARLTSRTAAG